MRNIFKELKGKDIRIKTWEEMLDMENTSLYEDDTKIYILFKNNNGNILTSFPKVIRHLCGKVIHVDENIVSNDLFLEADNLNKDRELLYYDNITDNYYYLDIDMFEVLEVPELKEKNEFYVIEETTHQKVFIGSRGECFEYYKTYVDVFRKQDKRIAVLREF